MLNLVQSKNDLIDFSKLKLGTVAFEIYISGSSSVSNTFLDKFFDGFKNGSDNPRSRRYLAAYAPKSPTRGGILLKLSLDILRCNFKSSMVSSNWNFNSSLQIFI